MNQAGFVDLIRHCYEEDRHELFLLALSITRCSDTAEDALHTAFERLLKRRKVPRELRPYVFRCVRNAAIDEVRRRKRGRECIVADPPTDSCARHEDVRLAQCLQELSDSERECILLKIKGDLTFKEVAEVCNVSINTASSWYRRGLAKLRDMLTEDTP